jgi:hypothetical protein
MPRYSSYPVLLDEVLTLKIKDLKKFGLIKKGEIINSSIKWSSSRGNESEILIRVDNIKNVVTLKYTADGTQICYNILLTQRTSNLGKGQVYYFLCPNTNKFCRNLYLANNYFLHRTATKGAMYDCQTRSKLNRNLIKTFSSYLKIDECYNEIYSKNFKSFYNGKPTKRYLALTDKIITLSGNKM